MCSQRYDGDVPHAGDHSGRFSPYFSILL
jgi:hypothetical protein